MGDVIILPPKRLELHGYSDVEVLEYPWPWMPTIGLVILRTLFVVTSRTSNSEVRLGIQTATTDTDVPNQRVLLGASWYTTVNRFFLNIDCTVAGNGDVNNHFYWRPVLIHRNAVGITTMQQSEVFVAPTYKA